MSQWTSVVVSAITAAGTLGVARAARRTPRQERRDDFTLITKNLRDDLTTLKGEMATQKADFKTEMAAQDRKIDGQASAIVYLHGVLRALVAFTRNAGLEPPAAAPPPADARPYLHDIGV